MTAPEQQETRNPADSPSGELPGSLPAATATDAHHHAMPEQQSVPGQADLHQRLETALRTAATAWNDTPPKGEHGADDGHLYDSHCALCRADAEGLAAAVLAALQPELAALREQLAAAHAENERLRAERLTASWDAFQAATIGLRFHAAYQSARRRANRYAHLLNQRPTS